MVEESEEIKITNGFAEKGERKRERERASASSGVERFLGVGVWHENKRGRAGFRTHWWCMRNYWGFTCTYWEGDGLGSGNKRVLSFSVRC